MSEQAPFPAVTPSPATTTQPLPAGARAAPPLGDTLPSAPHVVSRLVALTDRDADTRELLAAIERDPALTARILRTANSPFFAQTRNVTSVKRAVVVLGLPMVRNLTLGLTVWDATTSHIAARDARRLWEHSLAVATVAQHLATHTRACSAADAFTAGLLHDVGKLVLARQFPDAYRPLLVPTPVRSRLPALERAAVGHDHAEIGALLFERWRLPKLLIEAVARHHEEPLAPDEAGVVAAANLLLSCARPDEHVPEQVARDDEQHALEQVAPVGVTAELWHEARERTSATR